MVARSEFQTEKRLRLCQRGGGFGLQRVFGDIDDFCKTSRVLRRDVRENFAVQSDLGRLQTFHKAAVGEASVADSSIDARLPQVTERSLACFAVTIGVLAAMI